MKLALVLSATDKMSRVVDSAVSKSVDKMNKFKSSADKMGKNMQKWGAGLTAVGGVVSGVLTKEVDDMAKKAKTIELAMQKMSMSAEDVQKFANAAAKANVDISGLETGVGKLQKTMVEAARGNKKAAVAFKMAGLSIYDSNGNLKSTNVMMTQLSDKFKNAKDGPRKVAVAMALFGKSGKDLIPFLNKGSKSIEELAKEHKEFGAVLSSQNVKELAEYRKNIAKSKLAMEGMRMQLSLAVLPIIIKVTTVISKLSQKLASWRHNHKTLFDSTVKIIGGIALLMTLMGTFLIATGTIIRSIAGWKAITIALKNSMLVFRIQYYGLVIAQKMGVIWTKAVTASQWLWNAAMSANPIGLIVIGIAALVAVIAVCWKKFAGFRAVIKTVWETVKGFGGILKDYIIDRVKGIISGLGSMGRAIALLFRGQFKAAGAEALKGVKDLSGYTAAVKAAGKTKKLVTSISSTYTQKLAVERAAEKSAAKSVPAKSVHSAVYAANSSVSKQYSASPVYSTTVTNSKTQSVSSKTQKFELNYNPTIHVGAGTTAADKTSFAKMLRDHKQELKRMIEEIQHGNSRVAFS